MVLALAGGLTAAGGGLLACAGHVVEYVGMIESRGARFVGRDVAGVGSTPDFLQPLITFNERERASVRARTRRKHDESCHAHGSLCSSYRFRVCVSRCGLSREEILSRCGLPVVVPRGGVESRGAQEDGICVRYRSVPNPTVAVQPEPRPAVYREFGLHTSADTSVVASASSTVSLTYRIISK